MTVRRLPPLVLALVLGLLAAFAVACGDDGDETRLLGPRTADKIRAALDDLEEQVERGRCEDELDEDLDRLSAAVAAVPSSVDRELRVRLGDGVQHLRRIAREDCEANAPETTPETAPETTPETTPETVPTDPPDTVETTPQTTTTPPPTTTGTTPPPDEPDEPVLPEDTGGDEAPGAAIPPGQVRKGDKR